MNTTIFSPCQIHYRVNQPPARQNNAKLIECISRKCPTMHGIAAQDSFSKQILMNPTSPSCFCWSQCYNIHMCQIDYISLLYDRTSVATTLQRALTVFPHNHISMPEIAVLSQHILTPTQRLCIFVAHFNLYTRTFT